MKKFLTRKCADIPGCQIIHRKDPILLSNAMRIVRIMPICKCEGYRTGVVIFLCFYDFIKMLNGNLYHPYSLCVIE